MRQAESKRRDKGMKAYHWLKADMRAGSGNEPAWTVGESRTWQGPLKICQSCYHFSPSPWDGLDYAPGPILCLVEVEGVGAASGHTDKGVCLSLIHS